MVIDKILILSRHLRYYRMYSSNECLIFSHKKVFLIYIASNERPQTFANASLQKYFNI